MLNIARNVDQPKLIQGKRFRQNSLPSDLRHAIAGQPLLFKGLLLLLSLILCIKAGMFIGFFGGLTGANIISNSSSTLLFEAMIVVTMATMTTAILHNWGRSLFVLIISIFIVTTIVGLLDRLEVITLASAFPVFVISTIAAIAFGLAISGINFFITRFVLAFVEVLLSKSRFLKISCIFIISFSAIVGAQFWVWGEMQLKKSALKETLLEPGAQAIVIACGIGYGVCLAFSAWVANHLRGTPWEYPGLLRTWALAAGSWWGTSFQGLDLSEVNFREANLANTDLRARKLYRTCFQGVIGLARARVDNRYLDLELPKVQKLLTHGCSQELDFSQLNLRGAYLQDADLQRLVLIDTNLTGADLQGADLRGSILVRAQVVDVDFTDANLTGICIEDWSINSQTRFTNVQCDYIYRRLNEKGKPTDRYPADRNFGPKEFAELYQEVSNVVELVFEEGVNWRAFSFGLQKLQIDDDGLGLELRGVEKRSDRWVVKVAYNEHIPGHEVEQRVTGVYKEMKKLLAVKEKQINQLLGILSDQAEVLKDYSKQPFGNNFFITGSTITNLAGSGQIEYNEAAAQVRTIVANGVGSGQVTPAVQRFLAQLQQQSIATTSETQIDLLQQVILAESEKDPIFQQLLVQQGQQVVNALPAGAIAVAVERAIAQLNQ
jgi:uncharacterized protein YjbI with pentapeptide repeats